MIRRAEGCAAVRSLATKHAVRSGMGAGDFAAQNANLRAMFYIFGPLLLTRTYSFAMATNRSTSLSFMVMIVLGVIVPELMHCSWKNADLFPPDS